MTRDRTCWPRLATCAFAGVVAALVARQPAFAVPAVIAVLLVDGGARRRGVHNVGAGMLVLLGAALLVGGLYATSRNCPADRPGQDRTCSRPTTALLRGPALLAAGTVAAVVTANRQPAAR